MTLKELLKVTDETIMIKIRKANHAIIYIGLAGDIEEKNYPKVMNTPVVSIPRVNENYMTIVIDLI